MNTREVFRFRYLSLQTKVLLPVVTIMVLLVALAMWVINRRIVAQIEKQAGQSLATANAVFRNSLESRAHYLVLRFRNLANEPRYRANALQADPETMRSFLNELLLGEIGGNVIQYKTAQGKLVANARRGPDLDLVEFENRASPSCERALEGTPTADTIRFGNRLCDVVSVPFTVGNQVIGVLTIGLELGEAEATEFSKNTGCGVVLLVRDRIAGASVQRGGLFQQCVVLFGSIAMKSNQNAGKGAPRIHNLALPEEHFLGMVDKFNSLSGDPDLGYVLLYSNEQALSALQATQRTIVWVSLFGILLSTSIVWALIRRATRPLRQLRDSAEAVGRGDFTRRVEVNSEDECGELAAVFNRMTANLESSHRALEETVRTLKTTQAQLIQSEKLSAIGEFVAGVTHELNNPLTSLLGFAELLQQTGVSEPQRRFVDRIGQSAQRCRKIVRSLLSFSRQHQPERKLTNLNPLVESTLEIMAYEMRTSSIELSTDFDEKLPEVMVDAHQIQQVFLNIVNNARQAIEGSAAKGWFRAKTDVTGDKVRVIFQDNGPGIAEENLTKIFNPFFTTKEAGKGTGLGLSLSYGIIQDHGGTIAVQSKLGEGATFIITLPVASEQERKSAAPDAVTNSCVMKNGEGKKVLVVDDEEAILDLVGEVLTCDGYEVDKAHSGEAALGRLRNSQYHLTLCDWKMPEVNGQQVYERLRCSNPKAAGRFMFMTGDVINERIQQFLKKSALLCLAKPFSLQDFRVAVSKLT